MKNSFRLAALLLCTACASQIMEGYVGKSISEPILDYGPPANEMDLGNGRRAFQWQMQNSGVVPITNPSTTTVFGGGSYATAYSQTTNYVPFSKECFYTLTATRRGTDYIVDGYRKPRLGCE